MPFDYEEIFSIFDVLINYNYAKILNMRQVNVMNQTSTHIFCCGQKRAHIFRDLVNTNIIFTDSGYNIRWLHLEYSKIADKAVR